jgi:hypothetical protein
VKKSEMLKHLKTVWPEMSGDALMAVVVCQLSAPRDISVDALLEGARKITFLFCASDPGYEMVSHATLSPFDGKWYVFTCSNLSGSFIPEPSVHESIPPWYVNGNEGLYPYRNSY